jgi:hypothetical protein
LNIFMAPVGSGGIISLNRNVIDENRNSNPIKLRTMMNAIFNRGPLSL